MLPLVLLALTAAVSAQNCGLFLGVVVETSQALYSYEHVPNVDTHEGCVSVFAPTNAFPAASTPAINSQNTKTFPFVLTLATNPASQACGLRQIQSGNLVSWRFTFPSAFSYLCPSDASQPSALLALTPSSSGFTAVVNQGNTLYSLLAFNWDGTLASNTSLAYSYQGKVISAATSGADLTVTTQAGAVIFWPVLVEREYKMTQLPDATNVLAVVEDTVLQQFFMLYQLPGGTSAMPYYSIDCALPTNAYPPSPTPILPVAGNSSVFATRGAYDGSSHNWWQFTDNGALSQYSGVACPLTAVNTYAVPASTPLPWGPNDYINVMALAHA